MEKRLDFGRGVVYSYRQTMKIIFSRKGFDTASGGAPSPIFPDGRMLALPIPDRRSPISYQDLSWNGHPLGGMVSNLTKGKISPQHRAHLDPDLYEGIMPRHDGWRPVFGQTGASQGHLRNQGVGLGDLFLYFGLFQEVIVDQGRYRLKSDSFPRHVIWGWFQVDASIPVDHCDRNQLAWAANHPHFHRPPDRSNTVYFACEKLNIPGVESRDIEGAGVFPYFSNCLQLTAPGSRPSLWKLPSWLYPSDEAAALSYHGDLKRWKREGDDVQLKTVGRGQEFVFDTLHYPDAIQWLRSLFEN